MDDFAEGWTEFEEFLDGLMTTYHLSIKDIKEYVKMYEERQ